MIDTKTRHPRCQYCGKQLKTEQEENDIFVDTDCGTREITICDKCCKDSQTQ